MTSNGRYTLVLENEYKHLIPVSNSNNIKVDLASVDRYTTKFSSPQQIIEELKNRQIIVTAYRSIYISYRANKAEQRLEVAFNKHKQLSEIAQKSDSKVNINSPEFNRFINKLLNLLDNNSFYKFLLNQKVNDMYIVNEKSRLKDYLDERYSVGRNDNFTISKIKEHMSSYKKFRDVYFAVYEYNKIFERLFRFLDDPIFCHELLSAYKISLQTKKYINGYLNNPSEYLKGEIKGRLEYSELIELDRIIAVFEERKKQEEEINLKEEQIKKDIIEEMFESEGLKEKYPEAYIEHKMNPYSSYEEEMEYEQYMDSLVDEKLTELEEEPKIKVLKRNKVDYRQITLFDK